MGWNYYSHEEVLNVVNIHEQFSQECQIGNRTANNRFLAQPVEHNQANKVGGFSDPMLKFYRKMSEGKWGVIVMETTGTSMDERCRQNGLVLDSSVENEESWSQFFSEMKSINPESLWIVEISAAGFKNESGPRQALFKGQHEMPNGPVMTREYVDKLLDDYVHATRLAYERGADGIDIKLCHTYFAGLFLRPNNQRSDAYGGNFDKRTYFLREYFKRAQKLVGDKDFLWTTRMNAWDGAIPGGFGMDGPKNEDDGRAYVRNNREVHRLYTILAGNGVDMVNISAGIGVPVGLNDPRKNLHPNFALLQRMAVKAKFHLKELAPNITVASTGWSAMGAYGLKIGSEYLKRGVDFIGYGRQQLCEPTFPKIVLEDAPTGNEIDYLEDNCNICIVCGKCYAGLHGEGPVECPIYPFQN